MFWNIKIHTVNDFAPVANHLVAYYPFNGNAKDESGNGHHGIVSEATLTADRFGNAKSAYNFDGNMDYIVIWPGKLLNIPGSLSISCWINPRSFESYDAWISKASFHKSRSQWRAGFGKNKGEWGLTEFTVVGNKKLWMDYWVTESKLKLNTWVHVATIADQKSGKGILL